MNEGFILIHRKITKWEWYQNPNTFRVFIHCLLMANFVDGRFEGREVKRGQFVTSLPNLAKQTSLTIQQVRTALEHLKSTGEITDKGYSKYRVITVVKYDDYQNDNRQNNRQVTDNQQTDNRQVTDNQQQYNNNNKGTMEQCNNGNHHLPVEADPGFMTDTEAHQIQNEHDSVLEAAKNAGFKCTDSEIAELLRLYSENSLEKMLAGFTACVDHSAPNLAYLRAVLKGKPKELQKPPARVLPAQDFSQRDYSGVQDEIMENLKREMAEFKAMGSA